MSQSYYKESHEENTHRRELDVGIVIRFDECRIRQRDAAAQSNRRNENPLASLIHHRRYRGGVRLTKSQKSRSRQHFIRITVKYVEDPCRAITPQRLSARLLAPILATLEEPGPHSRMESKLRDCIPN